MAERNILILLAVVLVVGVGIYAVYRSYDAIDVATVPDDTPITSSEISGTVTNDGTTLDPSGGIADTNMTASTTATAPGVPNTGMGGNAWLTALVLLFSGAIAAASSAYAITRPHA